MEFIDKEIGKQLALQHISNRYFNNSISWELCREIKKRYGFPKWEKAKLDLDENSKISKSAIKIAEVMKAKMNIDLFPSIHKIAHKGWDISGGTFAFYMIDDNGNKIYFADHAKYYKSIKADYCWYSSYGDECIIRN